MKIVNIILCVLILLLGIASAVFSYFLFEKRSQFVTGWAKMAETMNKTAAALDKNSGTRLASKLTAQTLAHDKYSNLDVLLPELPQQSANIITERDALASALTQISRSIQMDTPVQLAKLQDLNTYSAQKESVVMGVNTLVGRRDKCYRNLTEAFRSQLNINLDRELLLKGNTAAFDEFKRVLGKRNTRKNIYENHFREIAGILQVSSPDFGEEKYHDSLKKILADMRAYQSKNRTTATELRQAKAEIDRHQNTIARMKDTVKSLKTTIADKDLQLANFQRAFGIPDAAKTSSPWQPGSAEARAKLTGKVTMVNSKYGYLTMNIGKYSVVQQHIGNRMLEINPKIEPGLEMLISRKAGDKKNFIARVKISQVGESVSVANIPAASAEIKVGDEITIAPVEKAAPVKPEKKSAKTKK